MKNGMRILHTVDLSPIDYVIIALLLLVAFLAPAFNLPAVENLTNAVPAVFAIATGFFINDAMSNYLRLQTLIAEEDATLISITHMLRTAPEVESASVEKAVDDYLVKVLQSNDLDHVAHTQKEYDTLLSSIDSAIGRVPRGESAAEALQGARDRLLQISQEVAIAVRTNLTFSHWLLVGILELLVCLTFLAMRDTTFITTVVVALMMVASYAILVVLRDVDNNKYLARKLSFRSVERVFHALNVPPFYPYGTPARYISPDSAGKYRTINKEGVIVEQTGVLTR